MTKGPSREPAPEIEEEAKEEERKAEETGSFVMPGDLIGASEEFEPGEGTYEEMGDIYASTTGMVNINSKTRSVSVSPKTNVPPHIKVGDIVVGRIKDLKGSVALVEIAQIKDKGEREIVNVEEAAIHVSNVKDAYVKDLFDEFSPFDIVKAKVIDLKNMRLSTVEKELGVMKAFCSRCRSVLEKKDDSRLKCPKCERIETRKISLAYGTGVV